MGLLTRDGKNDFWFRMLSSFPGHIACSSASKSEIVVPVFDRAGNVAMVLDIDSDQLNDFSEIDQAGLERIARLITDL